MKKLFFLMIVLAGVAVKGFGQTTPAVNADVAVAAFEAQNFDFGKIKQGTPVTHEFKFTNTGKVPMIITNVQASCGCTTPDWSKEPIPAGGKGFIKATYNAASVGAFNKAVTVTANIPNGSVQLFIKGEVTTTPVNNK
ncbi:MAG: DUF1573 domain-containing protein [Bacteroidota bacterium]